MKQLFFLVLTCMTDVQVNSQQLWLLTQDLHKLKPVNILACMEEGSMKPQANTEGIGC